MPSTSTRESIYSATIGAGSPFVLRQLEGNEINPGQSLGEIIPGGAVDRANTFLNAATPTVGLRSMDLTTILNNISLTVGLNCPTGAVFRGQRRVDGGVFGSGTLHTTWTSTKGWLGIGSIGAVQGTPAVASLAYWALHDGSNVPLVSATGQALGGSSPQLTSLFYLGPVYLNGSRLPDVQSISIDPGLGYEPVFGDGEVWPQIGFVRTRTPRLQMQSNDPGLAEDIGGAFLAQGTTLAFYLRKAATGNLGRVADDSGEHIKITMATGAIAPSPASVSENSDWSSGIVGLPNTTISVSLTSTIP
jgi:hypothetical protein